MAFTPPVIVSQLRELIGEVHKAAIGRNPPAGGMKIASYVVPAAKLCRQLLYHNRRRRLDEVMRLSCLARRKPDAALNPSQSADSAGKNRQGYPIDSVLQSPALSDAFDHDECVLDGIGVVSHPAFSNNEPKCIVQLNSCRIAFPHL